MPHKKVFIKSLKKYSKLILVTGFMAMTVIAVGVTWLGKNKSPVKLVPEETYQTQRMLSVKNLCSDVEPVNNYFDNITFSNEYDQQTREQIKSIIRNSQLPNIKLFGKVYFDIKPSVGEEYVAVANINKITLQKAEYLQIKKSRYKYDILELLISHELGHIFYFQTSNMDSDHIEYGSVRGIDDPIGSNYSEVWEDREQEDFADVFRKLYWKADHPIETNFSKTVSNQVKQFFSDKVTGNTDVADCAIRRDTSPQVIKNVLDFQDENGIPINIPALKSNYYSYVLLKSRQKSFEILSRSVDDLNKKLQIKFYSDGGSVNGSENERLKYEFYKTEHCDNLVFHDKRLDLLGWNKQQTEIISCKTGLTEQELLEIAYSMHKYE